MTNEQNNSRIEAVVMRRVHRIHFLQSYSGLFVSCLLLAVALLGIGRQVWVARVFENAPSNAADFMQFFLAAFSHTHLIVQALTLLATFSLIYLARASARFITSALIPART